MLGNMHSSQFDPFLDVSGIETTLKMGKKQFFSFFGNFSDFFDQIHENLNKKITSVSQIMTKFMANNLWEVFHLRNFTTKPIILA